MDSNFTEPGDLCKSVMIILSILACSHCKDVCITLSGKDSFKQYLNQLKIPKRLLYQLIFIKLIFLSNFR